MPRGEGRARHRRPSPGFRWTAEKRGRSEPAAQHVIIMIDKATALTILPRRLEALPVGHALDLRTYKRNRSVVFVRHADDAFLVLENGFEQRRFDNVPMAGMRKLLKTLLNREFPRSTKLRLYDLGPFEDHKAGLPRKTI